MPKTNNTTGATYAGYDGIVEHAAPLADGRTLSELNPEKNLDGTLIEGDHPDFEGDDTKRDVADLQADSTTVRPVNAKGDEELPEDDDDDDEEPSKKSVEHGPLRIQGQAKVAPKSGPTRK